MKRISRDHFVTILAPENPPALKITSGEEVMVETWDAFKGVRDASELSADSLVAPVTGPIYIEGAEVGDAIMVDLIDITPKEEAVHMVIPERGFLPDEFPDPYSTVMQYDRDHILLPGGLRLPTQPSVGFIATTPTYPQSSASDSGPYGGDMDVKELLAGSTIYLPVLVPGGMLTLGDVHALVGDGAVGGTGAETSADVHIRVTTQKDMPIQGPRALTPDHFIVLSYGEDLGPAMKQAVRNMVDFLTEEVGMGRYDAYTLLSIAGDVRVSRTFRPISPVKMMLSRHALDQLQRQV